MHIQTRNTPTCVAPAHPQVFLNDEPFTDRFMRHVRAATRARVYFGQVPPEEWAVPASVDMDRARKSWDLMQRQHVAYADSQSYRQMCRYQSGLFMNHPLMQPFDYYWRIEPGVSYFCEMLDPDPFRVMRDRQKKYGWVITLRDEYVSFLWPDAAHARCRRSGNRRRVGRSAFTQRSARSTRSTR